MAIVALTKDRIIVHGNGTETNEPYFDWSSQQKGFALGSFFYGYILTQVLGGTIATKIGGNWVID